MAGTTWRCLGRCNIYEHTDRRVREARERTENVRDEAKQVFPVPQMGGLIKANQGDLRKRASYPYSLSK